MSQNPVIVLDPLYSYRSSRGQLYQFRVANFEELAGYVVKDNDGLVVDIGLNSDGVCVYSKPTQWIVIEGYPDSQVEIRQPLMPPPTLNFSGNTATLTTDFALFESYVNQDQEVIGTDTTTTIDLSTVPSENTAVGYMTNYTLVSELVSLVRNVTVTAAATYSEGVITITASANNASFPLSSVSYSIDGVNSVNGIISLRLNPGSYLLTPRSTDSQWNVSFTPIRLIVPRSSLEKKQEVKGDMALGIVMASVFTISTILASLR